MKTQKINLRRILSGALIICLMCALSAAAQPWKSDDATRPSREERAEKFADKFKEIESELGITPEQHEQMKALRTESRTTEKVTRQRLNDARKALRTELQKDTIDTARVNALIEETKEATGEGLENKVRHIIAMKKLLTPEQFSKLQEKIRGRAGKRGPGKKGFGQHKKNEQE